MCSSGMAARGGSFATNKIVSATSAGCRAWARISGEGFTGLFSNNSVSTRPGQMTEVLMLFLFLLQTDGMGHAEKTALGRLIRSPGDICDDSTNRCDVDQMTGTCFPHGG